MGASPDWVKLAEAFGATGMRVTDKGELVDAHEDGARDAGPRGASTSHVTKEENCYPMIPAGQAARDMVG